MIVEVSWKGSLGWKGSVTFKYNGRFSMCSSYTIKITVCELEESSANFFPGPQLNQCIAYIVNSDVAGL